MNLKRVGANKRKLATTFLFGSMVFFAVAGAFFLYQRETPVQVALDVFSWEPQLSDKYGNAKLRQKDAHDLKPGAPLFIELKHEDRLNLDFSNISTGMRDLEAEIRFQKHKFREQIKREKMFERMMVSNTQKTIGTSDEIGSDDNGDLR